MIDGNGKFGIRLVFDGARLAIENTESIAPFLLVLGFSTLYSYDLRRANERNNRLLTDRAAENTRVSPVQTLASAAPATPAIDLSKLHKELFEDVAQDAAKEDAAKEAAAKEAAAKEAAAKRKQKNLSTFNESIYEAGIDNLLTPLATKKLRTRDDIDIHKSTDLDALIASKTADAAYSKMLADLPFVNAARTYEKHMFLAKVFVCATAAIAVVAAGAFEYKSNGSHIKGLANVVSDLCSKVGLKAFAEKITPSFITR